MVVVALMSVIVLGLMAMFNQTQRAFRLGMSQTDVLESGRMATDLIARELQEMTPCSLPNFLTANYGAFGAPNCVVQVANSGLQSLPGGNAQLFRTNVMSDVFFLVRRNQTLTGIGYFVRTNRVDVPTLPGGSGLAGTLYRFETNNSATEFQQHPGWLFAGYLNVLKQIETNNISKIVDGVVHFKVRPFDTDGWTLTNNPSWWVNPVWSQTATSSLPSMLLSTNLDLLINNFGASGEDRDYYFYSNAVPAALEFELGVLEQKIYDQYKSIPIDAAQKSFLTNQAAHVHLFRQRVAIRNVDPSAYQ